QPIRLMHPTSYHIEQTQLRNKRGGQEQATNNDESNSPQDLEYGDPASTIMSPLSNSSPIGSPPTNSYEPDEYIGMSHSLKHVGIGSGGGIGNGVDASGGVGGDLENSGGIHVDTGSQFGESPGTQPSIYSPGPDNTDFFFDTAADFSTSAPARALDLKTIPTKFFNNRTHNNSGFSNQYPVSMSLPVTLNQPGTEWFGTSLDQSSGFAAGAHPSSIQFPTGDMPPIMSGEFLQEDETAEKRALMNEKRRKRRESHNAVERRRRDNINEKIQELSTLLPDLYNDSANKPNKGVILRKSVDYIRDLKKIVDQQGTRNQELEALVRDLQSKMNTSSLDGSTSSSLEDQTSSMNMLS
ncbi:3319_t:CDS:2, partial [Ambispora gerdemannii]